MRFILFLVLFSTLYASEEEAIKRVNSHLLIHNYHEALRESEAQLAHYPESKELKKVYVRALAENGKNDEAVLEWKRLQLKDEPELLESLAWGVLAHYENSSQFVVNLASLMSAYYTNDVRAVHMLLKELHSSNAYLRAMAVQLSARYRDSLLIEELKRLLFAEKIWFVRLEVIKALGAMGVKEIEEPLKKIITQSRTTAEEKAIAIAALVNIYEDIGEEELAKLALSNRAGLRHLACEIITHLDLREGLPWVEKFLNDPTPEVRVAALNALYLLGLKDLRPECLSKLIDLTADAHPPVALTAAWIISRFAPETALQVVRNWVYSTDESSRRLAAFVLGKMGTAGTHLAHEVLQISPDPYVKANLALGGLGMGGNHHHLADVLYAFLMLRQGKVTWDHSDNPLFKLLVPSEVCHVPQVPQYPTMVDQLTRLEILGILARLKHPHAEDAVKLFLKKNILGVTYTASMTLLEEGGEETIAILRDLLQEKDENIRLQAALVLALTGGEPEAMLALQKSYKTADREMKVNILGALGHIGEKESIPFLIEVLEEPYQVLKVVAASALIQCIYR